MINFSDSIICITKEPFTNSLFLKYKIMNNKLYAYNFYFSSERRRLLEVKSINNVLVSSILNEISENDLYSIDGLKKFNIDIEKELYLELVDNDKTIVDNIYSGNFSNKIFEKNFDLNEYINDDMDFKYSINESNNKMLNYASTNLKSSLAYLYNIMLSSTDKNELEKIIKSINDVNNIYCNIDNNLDMQFLSSELLMMESKFDYMPSFLQNYLSSIILIDKNLENNNAILTDGEIDYHKVFKMIRNSLAHSNYKVDENGYVIFYNEGKNKMNFEIDKVILKYIFKELFDFYYLGGKFPYLYSDKIMFSPNSLSEKEFKDYLNNAYFVNIENYAIKKSNNQQEQSKIESNIFDCIRLYPKRTLNLKYFDYETKRYCESLENYKIVNSKLSDEAINYIMDRIKEMGIEHFLNLGRFPQLDIIYNILRYKYTKQYYMMKNLNDVVSNGYDGKSFLAAKSDNYIKLRPMIELLITTVLNNIFLFCYNQNKASINFDIKLSNNLYKDYLEFRVRDFYNISKESADYECIYNLLLKVASVKKLDPEELRNVEKMINLSKNRLIKFKSDIEAVNHILNNTCTKEELNAINEDILTKIRNSLAHGRLSVECKNFNNIMNSSIIIKDVYENIVQYESNTSFMDIINSINNKDFLKSLLDDNQNFIKHTK